jgi:hypothetical protein
MRGVNPVIGLQTSDSNVIRAYRHRRLGVVRPDLAVPPYKDTHNTAPDISGRKGADGDGDGDSETSHTVPNHATRPRFSVVRL